MKPVITVTTHSEVDFQNECANAIQRGYRLVTASCGFADSEAYDFAQSWQAVLALPEALRPTEQP